MWYTWAPIKLQKPYPTKDIIFASLAQYPKQTNNFPSVLRKQKTHTQPNPNNTQSKQIKAKQREDSKIWHPLLVFSTTMHPPLLP